MTGACFPTQKYEINIVSEDTRSQATAKQSLPKTVGSSYKNSVQPRTSPNPQSNFGLTAIVADPSVSASQADAICQPKARRAQRAASSSYTPRSYGSSTRCTQDYFGDFDCNSSALSGGFWGGIDAGLDSVIEGKHAFEDVLSSCLAQLGWSN